MAGDRGVEANLRLVEAEAVLAELEIFFYRPPKPGGADQPGQGGGLALGHVAVVERQLPGLQVAPDQQVAAGASKLNESQTGALGDNFSSTLKGVADNPLVREGVSKVIAPKLSGIVGALI